MLSGPQNSHPEGEPCEPEGSGGREGSARPDPLGRQGSPQDDVAEPGFQRSTRQVHLAAALLLAVFALLCAHGLRWDTPTVDEFAHLPAGYHYLKTGHFDLFPLNPPLIKTLCALPLLALQLERNRAEYDRIFFFGRLPVVALGMLLCLVVFLWARELYGDEAGLIALLLA